MQFRSQRVSGDGENFSMPTTSTLRHINQTRVLHAVRANGAMSRAEIARDLKMMRSTAGNLVDTLIGEGLLRMVETDQTAMPRRDIGRPAMRVELNPARAHFLGAEVGVGYIHLVAIDLQSSLVLSAHEEIPITTQTPERSLEVLSRLVSYALTNGVPPESVEGLGISLPGPLDHDGYLARAPFLGWERIPFLDMVREWIPGIENVRGENDANAFAFSELLRQPSDLPNDVVFVWLDAGVGGAVCSGGKLRRGGHGHAGEFGHFYIGENELQVRTPLKGSLESFVGRDATLQRYRFLGGTARGIEDLVEHITEGNETALACLEIWSQSLARGLATITCCFDPTSIVVGGPMSVLLGLCHEETGERLRSHLLASSSVPDILISASGPDGAAIGCAYALAADFLEFDDGLVFGGTRSEYA